jgi:hypothetical protein
MGLVWVGHSYPTDAGSDLNPLIPTEAERSERVEGPCVSGCERVLVAPDGRLPEFLAYPALTCRANIFRSSGAGFGKRHWFKVHLFLHASAQRSRVFCAKVQFQGFVSLGVSATISQRSLGFERGPAPSNTAKDGEPRQTALLSLLDDQR